MVPSIRHGHFVKRWHWVLLASTLLVLGAGGCGGSGVSSSGSTSSPVVKSAPVHIVTTSVIPRGQHLRGDGDADNPGDIDGNGDVDTTDTDSDYPTSASYKFPDADDRTTFAYGHPASGPDARVIAGVVKRYYAAASASDGAAACLLLLPSFARSVPEAYGENGGPSYLHGAKSCPVLTSMLFRHFHKELAEPITIVEARVEGSNAQVVLSSRKLPASHIFLAHQGRSWRIQELLSQPLP